MYSNKMTIRPLSPALRKKAKIELNEDPDRVDAAIKELREWIDEQLPKSLDMPDKWLIAFLRGCKFNENKAKEKLKTYYCLSSTLPEIFAKRDPLQSEIQEILKIGSFLPLKNCSEEDDPRTCLLRPGASNGTKHRLTDLIKVGIMIIEILLLEDDNFTVAGVEIIGDVKNLSFGLMTQWTPMLARKVMMAAEKTLSMRLKSLHMLNAPIGFAYCFAILKLFLSAKIKNRIYFHNKSYDSLFGLVNRSMLPIEYGGADESLQELTDYWKAKVESYRDWFIQHETSASAGSEATAPEDSNNLGDHNKKTFRNLELD